MADSKPKGRNVYLIGAIVLVLLLFSYYFIAYVPSREVDLKNRGIRVMNRMTENIQDKVDHYDKSIDLFYCNYILMSLLNNSSDIAALNDSLLFSDCITRVPEISDTMRYVMRQAEIIFEEENPDDYLRIFEIEDSIYHHIGFVDIVKKIVSTDQTIKVIDEKRRADYLIKREVVVEDYYEYQRYYELGITAIDLFKGIKQYEFFDDIFVVDPETSELIDKSVNKLKHYNRFEVQKQISKTVGEEKPIPILKKDSIITGVEIEERTISNTSYFSYTTEVDIDGKHYYLVGLIDKRSFKSKVSSVSVWVMMISIVVLLFLIQILPIVKPFLLHKKEGLKSTDMLWSVIALIFGSFVITLFAIGIDTFALEEIHLIDKKLNRYAHKILLQFEDEKLNAQELLKSYRIKSNPAMALSNKDINLQFKNDLLAMYKYPSDQVKLLGINAKGSTFIYEISDEYGEMKVLNDIDIPSREYYRVHATEDSLQVWQTGDSLFNWPIYMQSISSLSTGKYTTVVSTKSHKDSIWAVVFPFYSVNNIYLEPDYNFYIIDIEGNIKYHSDQSKINSENLFDESNQNKSLHSFVRNASDRAFNVDFSLDDYRARIKPIKNTPWFLVTTYDIKQSRLTISTSMAVCFEFIISIIIYLLLIHGILFLLGYGSNKGQVKQFTYHFTNPLSIPPIVYKELLVVNLAMILYLLTVFFYNDFDLLKNSILFFATITLGILLNYSRLILWHNDDQKTQQRIFRFLLTLLGIGWLMVYTVYALFAGESTIEQWEREEYLIYIIPLLTLFLIHFLRNGKSKERKPLGVLDLKLKMYIPFYWHTFTWIVILGVIPVLLIFKPVYNQQHYNRTIENMHQEQDDVIHLKAANIKKVKLFNHYKDDSTKIQINQSTVSRDFFEKVNLYFDDDQNKLKGLNSREVVHLTLERGMDTTLNNRFFDVSLPGQDVYYHAKENSEAEFVAFFLPQLLDGDTFVKALFFWMTLGIALIFLYLTVVKLSEKFFYLRLTRTLYGIKPDFFTEEHSKEHLDDVFFEEIDAQLSSERNILLVGLPFSGRNNMVNAYLERHKKKPVVLDFLNDLEKVFSELKDLDYESPIIINNFDYRIFNFDLNIKKLEILEFILAGKNKKRSKEKLFLMTSLDIYQIIEIYRDNIKKLIAEKKKENETIIAQRKNDIDRWESALFGFSKHIIALKNTGSTIVLDLNKEMSKETEIQRFIEEEMNFGSALLKLKPGIVSYSEHLLESTERLTTEEIKYKLITAIQDRAENYYFSIWNSCSSDEKFILLDLAQDGLVNSINQKAIEGLVKKGIILLKPKLSIFNISYGHFIIESLSEEETLAMEKEAKKQSSWNTYRYLVIFLVIVIVIFLSLAEEKTFTQITGFVSLGAVLLPNILRVLNTFSFNKIKA